MRGVGQIWSHVALVAMVAALVGCASAPPAGAAIPATTDAVVTATSAPPPSAPTSTIAPSPTSPPVPPAPTATPVAALPRATPAATASPSPAGSEAARPLTAPLPRQVRYGGLELSVTSGEIGSRGPDGVTASDRAFAYLGVTVTNVTTTTTTINPGWAKLTLGDDKPYPAASTAGLSIPASSSVKSNIVFPVPLAATWDKASLVIDQPQSEPAVLPLFGPVPLPAYPIKLTVTGEAVTPPMTYRLTSGSIDLDYGLDRVTRGKRFVILSLTVLHDASPESQLVSDTSFRLLVDGQVISPSAFPVQWVAKNGTLSGDVVFVVAPTSTKADLQVGKIDPGPLAKIPVDLSPIK